MILLLANLIPGLDLSVHYCLFQLGFLPCILFCLHAHRTTVVLSLQLTSADQWTALLTCQMIIVVR